MQERTFARRVRRQHSSLVVALPPAVVRELGITAGRYVWLTVGEVAGAATLRLVKGQNDGVRAGDRGFGGGHRGRGI